MNDDQLNRLIAAARRAPPDTAGVKDDFASGLSKRLQRLPAVPDPAPGPWFGLTWQAVSPADY